MVVGITALNVPSQQQQIIPAFSITPCDGYDSVSKMNDIALISVRLSQFFVLHSPCLDFKRGLNSSYPDLWYMALQCSTFSSAMLMTQQQQLSQWDGARPRFVTHKYRNAHLILPNNTNCF